MFSSQTMWYAARSAGIISWILLSLSVIWGLLMSTKIVRAGARRAWLLGVHRSLGGFAVIFTFIHVLALIGDSYIDFGMIEVLVPMTSSWKPLAVSWGVVSFWIILAVEVSSLVKKRLPKKVWKYIHMSSLALFITAAVHGYTAGTDAKLMISIFALVLLSTPVFMLAAIRFSKSNRILTVQKSKSQPYIAPSYSDTTKLESQTHISKISPTTNPIAASTSEIQATQWIQTSTNQIRESQKNQEEELPPLVALPEMAHQKLKRKHRSIASLFDDIDPNDYENKLS